MSWGRYVRTPFLPRRSTVITVLLVLVLGSGLAMCIPWVTEYDSSGQDLRRGNTLTILTKPISQLPPHTHESDKSAVDSVYSAGHGVLVGSDTVEVPFDMWVTGISAISGSAPRSVIHHLILYKKGYPNPLCVNRDEEVYVVGADTKPETHFTAPYGVFLKKGTNIYLSGMVHNPLPPRGEGGTYKDVSVGYRLTYERDLSKRTQPLMFYRLFLSDTPHCINPRETVSKDADIFTVPVSTTQFKKEVEAGNKKDQARYTFTTSGYLLVAGGHLHPEDGGEEVRLYKNGSLLTTFIPVKLPDHPWSWVTLPKSVGIHIMPGDTLSIGATYSNKNPFPIQDSMAQVVLFMVPEDTASAMK